MARLRLVFAAVVVLLTLGWLASVDLRPLAGGFWSARGLLVPFTGILAIGFMGVAVLLAARPVQIESALGGLDKFYRLHKWLGIAGALMAVAHWLLETGPRWLIQLGWMERAQRGRGGGAGPRPLDLFADLRHPAAELGEWGLYLLLALTVLALWRRVPYHLFFKAHRLMAPLFLVLAFHAVVLTPTRYWSAPVGPLLGLLIAGAAVAAGMSIFRRIGKSRRFSGAVTDFHVHRGNSVLDVGVRLETAWPGHAAGQFAFLDFEDAEGAHPFTVSSGWANDGRLAFSIKGLGDYTRRLPDLVRIGQAVTIEGPYGRFDFRSSGRPQLWIAGGVGITPFIARMQALAHCGEPREIDLVYSTAAPDDGFLDEVRTAAAAARVRLHLVDSRREGLVDLARIAAWVPAWRDADVWFCGPARFGDSLRAAMTAEGLPRTRFHQELFELR
jgi:predicted ferric reductase